MNSAFEDRDNDIPETFQPIGRQRDTELTLSATTLLGLFFGLVLVCAVFFGLGYWVGRRASSDTSAQVGAQAGPAVLAATAGAGKPSASSVSTSVTGQGDAASDPSAADATADAPAKDGLAQPDAPGNGAAGQESAGNPSGAAPGMNAMGMNVGSAASPAGTSPVGVGEDAVGAQGAVPAGTVAPPGSLSAASVMVQIAAVSLAQDADALIAALKKKGYAVSARREPADTLLHVVVGPFAGRAEANAMRQKLLNDGYNAIVK